MRKKIIISVLCLVVAVGLLFGGMIFTELRRYERIISEIELRTPDLSQIGDGTFSGTFDATLISADVDVTVENHRIIGITIINHHHGRGSAIEAEAVIYDVVLAQSIEGIDAISGATNSSKVILIAIQNALENAIAEQP